MIDTASEELIPISLVPERIRLANGLRIDGSTIYRWTKAGCRGRILESIQIGGRRATTARCIQEFFDRLTNAIPGGDDPTLSRSLAQRQRRSEAAANELKRLGA